MLGHLFEVIFTSVGLFMAPLLVVLALAGALTLVDRLFHFLQEHQHPR
jgi:uncharacterized iron-regulated membrane protein